MPAKRGAPKGNQNALKHGAYTRVPPPRKSVSLPSACIGLADESPSDIVLSDPTLANEIRRLRIISHRVFILANATNQLDDMLATYVLLCDLSKTVASLLKTNTRLTQVVDASVTNAALDAIRSVAAEWAQAAKDAEEHAN